MTVIGALSSFRELGEMSPHNALIAINFRIDGEPEVGNCYSAFLRFAREAMPSNGLR